MSTRGRVRNCVEAKCPNRSHGMDESFTEQDGKRVSGLFPCNGRHCPVFFNVLQSEKPSCSSGSIMGEMAAVLNEGTQWRV